MKRKLRILILPSAVEKEDSAPTVHLKEIVFNLSCNHKLYLPVQQEHNIENDKNIYVKNLRLPHPQQTNLLPIIIYKIYFFLFTLWHGILLASKFKCEVLYVRHGISTLSGLLISKLKRVPIVIEINGIIADEEVIGRRRGGGLLRNLFFKLDKIACKGSTKIVAVTEGLRRFLVSLYDMPSNKIVVVPNGVNANLFKLLNEKMCKRKLNLDLNAKYVGFIGNLAPWQGVEYLIRAATQVLKKVPEARFLIVGDGIMMPNILQMIDTYNLNDKFVFAGRVTHNEIPEYINACDVCVAPFTKIRNEKIGLSPLKLYEYLACERAVVASNISGVGDFLQMNNCGIIVDPDVSADLSEAIIGLLRDDKIRKVLGRNGRSVVIKKHSWKKTAENIEKVCREVVYTSGWM